MKSVSKFTFIASACLFSLMAFIFAADEHVPSVSPDAALAKLKEGNARFVASKVSDGKPTAAKRAETAQAQHPFAIILGCADSRTAPEIIFDQNIGDLFVIRTAGNLVDDHALGSIEYAVEHLGARLIVVLGHERCGAVTAASRARVRQVMSSRSCATSSLPLWRPRGRQETRLTWPSPRTPG